MKVRCRCGLCLTTSLYPRKDWAFKPFALDEDSMGPDSGPGTWSQHHIAKGSFMAVRGPLRGPAWQQKRLLINPADLVVEGVLPVFKRGMGCCDLAWVDVYCPQCRGLIGQANLDCYQDKHVRLYEKQVVRDYGRFGVRRPAKPVRRRYCYPPGMGFFGMD